MLAQIGVNRFSFIYTNQAAPATAASHGTGITPGASDAEGNWTAVASSANIAQDVYGVLLLVAGGGSTGQIKDHLLDIGVDPAGGTAYVAVVSNLVCGESALSISQGAQGRYFYFPLFIKSGSSVAIRVQGSNATAGTVRVVLEFFGQPSHPELVRVGQYSETIGTITGSAGVSFTPGNSGAEGSWVSLGTTTLALWWWQLGIQCTNTVISDAQSFFDLAYGDGTNKDIIIQNLAIITATTERIGQGQAENCFCDVPAGAELFVRGSCSGTADTGWNAVAVGVGG